MFHIILSGGQTGVDQAALRAARAAHLLCAGWCPPDRACETGPIPACFPLQPTPWDRSERAPLVARSQRTEWNVRDSDGTLIVRRLDPGPALAADPGTQWTQEAARMYGKPVWLVWVWAGGDDPAEGERVAGWCHAHQLPAFDVAGRGTTGGGVAEEVRRVAAWARRHHVRVLNVAGPGEPTLPGIGDWTYRFLTSLFRAPDEAVG